MSKTFIPVVTIGYDSEEMTHKNRKIKERHLELFRDLMYFFNKNVVINYNNGNADNGSRNTDINICMWSAHKDAEMTFPETNEAFGLKFCADGIFVPSPDLISIAGLMEYDASLNKIFFLYDVCEFQTEEEYSLIERLIKELLIQIAGNPSEVDKKIKATLDGIVEAKMNLLTNRLLENEKRKSDDRKRRYEDNKVKLEEVRRQVRQLFLTIQTDEALFNSGVTAIERINTSLVKELEIMRANQKVRSIDIDVNGKIIVDTHPIYCNVLCEDNKTRRYLFGEYTLTVDISNGAVKFMNKDAKMRRPSCWSQKDNHPHVSDNGSGCLGSASTLIADCVDQYQWGTLIDILINYLESVNIADTAGKNYWRWDEIGEDGKIITGKAKWTNGRD